MSLVTSIRVEKRRRKDEIGTQKAGAKPEQALCEYLTSALARFALDLVARDDADEMIAHLPGEVGENVAPPGEIDREHRRRQPLGPGRFSDDLRFLRQASRYRLTEIP